MKRALIIGVGSVIGLLLVTAVVLRVFFFQLAHVEGTSMLPGLGPGAWVAVRTGATPQRGDIILFKGSDDKFRIRRVIALPGERLALDRHVPVINGEPAKQTKVGERTVNGTVYEVLREQLGTAEYEILHSTALRLMKSPEITVEQGYFVLTDLRELGIQTDSRGYGPIPTSQVRGVVRYVLSPGR